MEEWEAPEITEKELQAIRQAAIMEICPNSREPATPYEYGAVNRLCAFGIRALQNTKRSERPW